MRSVTEDGLKKLMQLIKEKFLSKEDGTKFVTTEVLAASYYTKEEVNALIEQIKNS